jgi:hypothetical protein
MWARPTPPSHPPPAHLYETAALARAPIKGHDVDDRAALAREAKDAGKDARAAQARAPLAREAKDARQDSRAAQARADRAAEAKDALARAALARALKASCHIANAIDWSEDSQADEDDDRAAEEDTDSADDDRAAEEDDDRAEADDAGLEDLEFLRLGIPGLGV